jgi:alpha-tubulin suppressor-like RCC1 family protein
VTKAGAVQCWGSNDHGQLGDGTRFQRLTPVPVKGLKGVVALTAGEEFTCALTRTGGVKCWGLNQNGELGNDGIGFDSPTPVDVVGLKSGVLVVAAGRSHACVATTGGAAKCWGSNNYGQLGDGTTTARFTPVNVSGLGKGIVGIAGGGREFFQEHTCAVTKAGGAQCWGYNTDGEVGDGTKTDRHAPVKVKSF